MDGPVYMLAVCKSFHSLIENNYQSVWAGGAVRNRLWIISLPCLLPYPRPSILSSYSTVTAVLSGPHSSSPAQRELHCVRCFIRPRC